MIGAFVGDDVGIVEGACVVGLDEGDVVGLDEGVFEGLALGA